MTEANSTLNLALDLIGRVSVSPDDGGCQQVIAEQLANLGFTVEHLRFDDVTNLWATRGTGGPLLVFAGHTDTVPAGNPANWDSDPYSPSLRDGYLYGRGAADMKGALAAMITAIEEFVLSGIPYDGTLGVLLTSDEEADAINGTVKVMDYLAKRSITIDQCVIGEPSSESKTGDTIRVGRRGSLHGILTIKGTEGHVAYPDKADNPIHRIPHFLAELTGTLWDSGNDHFPPTSLQISNIHAGSGTTNVIPGRVEMLFNFRFGTASSKESLMRRTLTMLDQAGLDYDLAWNLSGEPFLTSHGKLISAVCQAVSDTMGYTPELSTSGGTSDGRFIAPYGTEVVELGPVNATIHKDNERVLVTELESLHQIYLRVLEVSLTAALRN